jgi:hypothetical protein
MGQFFIKRGDKIQGPATLEQIETLRSKLKATDFIGESKNGPWKTWGQAEEELFPSYSQGLMDNLAFAEIETPVSPSSFWQPQPQPPQIPQEPTDNVLPKNNRTLLIGIPVGVGLILLFIAGLWVFNLSKSGGDFASGNVRKEVFDAIHRKLLELNDNSEIEQVLNTEISVAEAAADNEAEKAVVQLAKNIADMQIKIRALSSGKAKLLSEANDAEVGRQQALEALKVLTTQAKGFIDSDPNGPVKDMLNKSQQAVSELDELVNELKEQAKLGRAILPNQDWLKKDLQESEIEFVEAKHYARIQPAIYAETDKLPVLVVARKELVDMFGKAINGKLRIPRGILKDGKAN